MSNVIKVLTVADLHRNKRLISLLGASVKKHRPHLVAFLGDFLDSSGDETGKLSVEECAVAFSQFAVQEMIFIRGNHEDSAWWTFVKTFQARGREPNLLEGKAFVFGPLVIVGFPCLMCRGDGVMDSVPADPDKWLPNLIRPYGPAGRTLWLMHEPPLGTPLSERYGDLSGNLEINLAIERFLPWLVVFGHDHATPIKHGLWHHPILPRTHCINVGQTISGPLHYTLLTFTFRSGTPELPAVVQVQAIPWEQSIKLPRKV